MDSINFSNTNKLTDINFRKSLRNNLVDTLYNDINDSIIPNHISAFLIKSIHFHTPFYFLLGCFLLHREIALMSMIPLLGCLSLFFYFNGCFLTKLEYKLKNDNEEFINIIDPYIVFIFRDEINDDNRYYYTLLVVAIYFSIVAFILGIRYYLNI